MKMLKKELQRKYDELEELFNEASSILITIVKLKRFRIFKLKIEKSNNTRYYLRLW